MAKWDHDDLMNKSRDAATVVSANGRQVGGRHYSVKVGGTQHWDLFGPEYLMGYATKYLRWRKKGGIEDLEKAVHVLEKLIEVMRSGRARPFIDQKLASNWMSRYGLDWTERAIAHRILFFSDTSDIEEAIEGIRHLIETNSPRKGLTEESDSATSQKKFDDMTFAELSSELQRLEDGNAKAAGWGAAVGARHESIKEIKGVIARRKQGTPEDGAQHAALSPWIVGEEWFEDKKNITPELRALFFRERTRGRMLLEPHVKSDKVPRQIAGAYRLVPGDYWLLRIEDCPADLREYYPNLQSECNFMELDEKPVWQRAMYEWHKTENKFRLLPCFAAWHMETE